MMMETLWGGEKDTDEAAYDSQQDGEDQTKEQDTVQSNIIMPTNPSQEETASSIVTSNSNMMSEAQIHEQHIQALLALSQQEKAKSQPDDSLSGSRSGSSRSNLKPPPSSGSNRRLPVKKRTNRRKL